MSKLAILGAGPTALVAAHAAQQYGGWDVSLFAPGVKSPIWGAQYLHQPIPGASFDDPQVIRYQMDGTPEDYLKKVYADLWDGHISDDLRDQAHMAWDLRLTYDRLWSHYVAILNNWTFGANATANRDSLNALLRSHDMVVNTIPRKVLCMHPRQHTFKRTEIWVMGDSDRQRVPIPTREGMITYNGEHDISWYRGSRIFGYSTVEWPQHINKPPIPGISRVHKPINHNCDCNTDLKHLGRMGRWDKNILVHHAYADMTELLMIHEEER